jgi:hypothetical protein
VAAVTPWKRILRLLLLAALLPLAGALALAQPTAISNYATFSAALLSYTNINNFASNAVIQLTNAGQTIQITGNTTIDGTSNNVIIDGTNTAQLFHVATNAQLVLNNVVLLRGLGTNGGAIFNEGTLIVTNAIFAGNIASNFSGTNGGNAVSNNFGVPGTNGTAGGSAFGGAIYSTGPLTVYFALFLTNQAMAGSGGSGGNGANGALGVLGGDGGNGGAAGIAFGGAVMSTGASNIFFATQFISNYCIAGAGGNGGAGGRGAVVDTGFGYTGAAAPGGAADGGAVCLTGALSMSNCVFANNIAAAGGSGAQTAVFGVGSNGIPGTPAGGGGLYVSNSAPTAYIENTTFFNNACAGGPGGATEGNSTLSGDGGAAFGGGMFTTATNAALVNCTFDTNLAVPGVFGADLGTNNLSGTDGVWDGSQIYSGAGVVKLANSILANGSGVNVFGVTDAGYNFNSDGSLPRATTTSSNNVSLGLATNLFYEGGPFGTPVLPLAATNPAAFVIPGVPGLTFPAIDSRGLARGTPASAGAFEVNTIIPTNAGPPSITTQPTNETAKLGGTGHFYVVAAENLHDKNVLGFQWQLNGTNLFDNAAFSGSAVPTLTIPDLNGYDLGAYQVIVSPTLLDGAVTSAVVYLQVDIPPSIKSGPASRLNQPYGAVVNFKVAVGGAPPFYFQWLSNGVALANENEFSGVLTSNLTINPVTFTNEDSSYSVVVTNLYRGVTSRVARLTVVLDKTRPTVVIQSPAAGSRTNLPYISGTASDNAQVTNVFVWITNFFDGATNAVTNNAVLSTNGTTTKTWSNSIASYPGTNIVVVQSVDYSGNLSTKATRRFFYAVPTNFGLSWEGNGTVTGTASVAGDPRPTNGALLNLGEGYTLVARPEPKYLLTNWTFSNFAASSYGNTVHFIMTNNLSIQAHFVPSPFIPVAGAYNGLFTNTNGVVTEQTAGMVSHLVLGVVGAYSGRLLLDGAAYGLSGVFNIFGQATNRINRAVSRGGPVTVTMAVDWTNSQITGAVVVTNASGWKSALDLEEGAAPLAVSGEYTMLLQSTNAVGTVPPGDGYILVTNRLGNLTLTGALPDGSTFSQSVPVGKLGDVPVFANLYGHTGLLLGWIFFNSSNGAPQSDTNLVWIKPARRSGLFAGGFTNSLAVEGSVWSAYDGLPVSSGTLTISDASLNLTNNISFTGDSVTVGSGSSEALRAIFNPKSGALKLIFENGNGRATTTGYAAFLQDSTNLGGYFVTRSNAGAILLNP